MYIYYRRKFLHTKFDVMDCHLLCNVVENDHDNDFFGKVNRTGAIR